MMKIILWIQSLVAVVITTLLSQGTHPSLWNHFGFMVAVIVIIIIIMILPITTLAEPALPIIARKILPIFGTAVINVLFLSNTTTIHNNHTAYFLDDDSSSGKIIPMMIAVAVSNTQ